MEHPFFINGPPSNRPEALRWLSIAEKLLTNRDLVGSKSFATRARESDPTLAPATDQILGIVDTLSAGDKRINNHHFDYYSILQIPPNQTQNADFIADQYRRFALLLNPQNNNFPFSDQAFRLVVDAFSVLSNPLRKSMYDKELGFFLNLYPVASTPTPVNFVHHSAYPSIPSSNADQMFVNLPSQDQGSHAAEVSFSRDPQAGISMPVKFLTREQETVTSMAGSVAEQQHQQPQQPVTFLRQQAQPPVTSISFSNTDEQPATFLSLNQPQPVTSVRSLNTENPPFGIGLSSTRGTEPMVSVEQHGNQHPPERNENVVGNNENRSASTSDNVSNATEKEGNVDASDNRIPSFWTACPYCYIMYEFPLEYADCTLRCQNCKRAFQAVAIASPPPIIDGKDAYFCCWGFMPLGLSLENFERNRDNGSSWSPFSPMFTCPHAGGDGGSNIHNCVVGGHSNVDNLGALHNAGASISGDGREHFAPRIYVDDDDDVFVEVSEAGEESDEDWNRNKERNKAKSGKWKSARTGTPSKNAKKQQAVKAKNVEGNNDVNLQDGLATQDGVEMSHVVAVEPNKKGIASKTRRSPGRVAKHFGSLDLNVEFSNDVEEPIVQMSHENEAGEGEDDTVEVIGFFEGLDEFLSSLPILDVVDGDKVEAA
ncbi:uncharacterized protein LOC107828093 [Nicotiana tabacum]|uniref:Uncharacterized protein LOC107828093 n=5 Tax=Solanaceae TaxID=4070 RepID=A0A1S4DBP9_TOBAC|nr:PREDICTED: uncharacterized protein LOC104241903 [Nicotiana sylvestris]XP_016510831.1 PREDICTED: uncharacterized protein LOC107828093 [Nicotiana tabacum]WMP39867.1 hypothetical protein [Capsicum annuum]WMP39871.1 hypothetical protein [Nicotiana benthamiana]